MKKMGKDVGSNHYLPSSHGEEGRKGEKEVRRPTFFGETT